MAGVTVKMGVDASQFTAGMKEAQGSVKTLDAALKMNEKQLKATGDAEIYAANKYKLLNKQMEEQKKVVANIQKQMAEMKSRGVDETSEAYQKLERAMYNAAGKMMDIQSELNSLNDSEQKAAGGANELATNLQSINKKVSLDAVISGIGKITSGLESAGRKAIEVGEKIWDSIMDSAAYADDTATLAARMGLTIEEVQQMQYVASRFESPVETVAKTWKKVKVNMTSDSEEITEGFKRLGVATQEFQQGKLGPVVTGMRDYRDVFWETGEAIMRLTDEAEQEALAQKLLGRSWDELIPLFTAGRDAYEEALGSAPVNSEEAIENAAELNDKIAELEQSFNVLKTEVIGEIAPALTMAAETLEKLINSVTEYLQTPEGQQALQDMGDAVSGLFEDLSKIDPAEVVEGFSGVFNTIVGGLQWMVENKGTLEGILEAIVIAWGAAKLTGGALQVLQLVNGISGLSASAAATAGATAGASWAGAFASAAMKASPFLAFAYTLLNPAETDAGEISPAQQQGIDAEFAWLDAVKATMGEDQYNRMNNDIDAWNKLQMIYSSGGTVDAGVTEMQMLGYGQDWRYTSPDFQVRGKQGHMYAAAGAGRYALNEAEAAAIEEAYDAYKALYEGASDVAAITELENAYMEKINNVYGAFGGDQAMAQEYIDLLQNIAEGEGGENLFIITPELQDDWEQIITEEIGTITIPAQIEITNADQFGYFTNGAKMKRIDVPGHANGIWNVPWDGYPAILHKGERVLTATENQRYTTNNYFGTVNLNNGLEIEQLTESIDRRNKRQMAGFGAA